MVLLHKLKISEKPEQIKRIYQQVIGDISGEVAGFCPVGDIFLEGICLPERKPECSIINLSILKVQFESFSSIKEQGCVFGTDGSNRGRGGYFMIFMAGLATIVTSNNRINVKASTIKKPMKKINKRMMPILKNEAGIWRLLVWVTG